MPITCAAPRAPGCPLPVITHPGGIECFDRADLSISPPSRQGQGVYRGHVLPSIYGRMDGSVRTDEVWSGVRAL